MPDDATIELAGETLTLLPERALFLPSRGTLLVADLHLGKAETYRSLGVPMPEGIAEESLERLERAVRRTEPTEIVVLGDLVHCEEGMEDPVLELFEHWRRRVPITMSLIGGNHDAGVSIPRNWRIEIDGDARRLGPFQLRHEPLPAEEDVGEGDPVVIAGHLHPVLSAGEGARRVLAHAFVVDPTQVILPAFTPFARGARVRPDPDRGRRIFAIAEGQVVEA
ncbi:MAG: ligase-associated DNA damage response endonuclease PdeM [Phycisphaeraceae bacterium]|nr:ligase-associated DNA damage response endonuclease PdeM [Phycisphaeraceae bacterium]MCP4068541.1 ligase-associated DNA damage response endonuclease PdeM [Phycisphaeraceae bacterium]MCP4794566.1 ligase-associated DNA damage response endonuclease PdeM [Phycisphaeraceae bacterium]